jgi:hypothetical protein
VVTRTLLLLTALAVSAFAQAEEYLIEAELWLNGVQQGTPTLIVEPGQPASIARTDTDGEAMWRLEVEVEAADSHILSPGDALWLQVAIHQHIDGEWEHITDAMLGVPEGQYATLSVVDDDAEASPESAAVYLRIKTSKLRPAEP